MPQHFCEDRWPVLAERFVAHEQSEMTAGADVAAYELGRTAGELLLERLKTGKFSRRTVVLPVRLCPRMVAGR